MDFDTWFKSEYPLHTNEHDSTLRNQLLKVWHVGYTHAHEQQAQAVRYMVWRGRPPEQPGFYYWQGGVLTGDEVAIVQVVGTGGHFKPVLRANVLQLSGVMRFGLPLIPAYDGALDKFCREYPGVWAGPLAQPQRAR